MEHATELLATAELAAAFGAALTEVIEKMVRQA
jgi:hypothetical protein